MSKQKWRINLQTGTMAPVPDTESLSMADYVRHMEARYNAMGGYERGSERMGTVQASEAARLVRDAMAQARQELPERERDDARARMLGGCETLPIMQWLLSLQACVDWTSGGTAVLIAPPGIGKTVSCCRIALEAAATGTVVRYECAYSTGWLQSPGRRTAVELAGLFIADESRRALDAGLWIQSAMKEVINLRFAKRRRTIICYTGTLPEFVAGFGAEIWDRVSPELRYYEDAKSRRWQP